jgi:hypothetical protein
MNILSNSVHEKLSNHDKFVQLDNFDAQDSNNLEKETNPMHENDNEVSSNTDKLPQDCFLFEYRKNGGRN